jgi:hypothetical protein
MRSVQIVTVPYLDNKTESEARLLLLRLGLRVGKVSLASSTKPKGCVCEQIPAFGEKVKMDFVTGWLPSSKRETVLGRPAGIAIESNGSLLITDDWGGRIWRVRPA